jgi:phosphatidyl-myo-inositol dimannoside synthase
MYKKRGNNKLLFVVLYAFSQMGGIEKFNRSFIKALSELKETSFAELFVHSLYDSKEDTSYTGGKGYVFFKSKRFLFLIKTIYQSFKSDIIIIGHLNLAIVGVIARSVFKKKVVVICHALEIIEPVKGIKKKLLKDAEVVLAVSDFTKGLLIEQQGVEQTKIIIFPNTIDPYFNVPGSFQKPSYLQERYGISAEDKILFTLARLSSNEKYKGYDSVIRALGNIKKKHPSTRYFIGGKADEQEKKYVEKLISENNLENDVQLLGYIKDEEVADHFQLSDVFVMPSAKEGFGIVFLEAMTCGLQVVAGDKDGSTDALLKGRVGKLVNPYDVNSIQQGIIDLLNNAQHVDKKQLQQTMLENFGYPVFKGRLKRIIDSLV